MSELSQRIVTSHKEAAKRAAEYLSKARKLKLSSVESLELVARTLGVANWPTLQAMAKQGRGPRIDDGQAPATVAAPVAAAPEKTVVERLKDYYGTDSSWGECPDYTREEWQDEVSNEDTLLGYWETVENMLGERGYMLPWERDADANVKLATEAGLEVVHASEYEHADDDEDNGWFVVRDGDALFDPDDSESDAWARAAKYVLAKQLDAANEGHLAYMRIQPGNVFEAIERMSAFSEEQPEKHPGAMTDEERKGSEHIKLAQLAGRYVHYERQTDVDFFPGWSVFDAAGNDLIVDCETESEAWELAAIEVRNEVCKAHGLSLEQWKAMWLRDRCLRVASYYGSSELLSALGGAVSQQPDSAGAMCEEDQENFKPHMSIAKAASTKVERRAEGWVIYESQAQEATRVPAQPKEAVAWIQAALIVVQEVLLRTEMTAEAFIALPMPVRIRHIEEAYKGRTCWIR